MTKSAFSLIILALAAPSLVQANATVQVIGKCDVALPTLTDFTYEGMTVFSATVQALDNAAALTVEKASTDEEREIAKHAMQR